MRITKVALLSTFLVGCEKDITEEDFWARCLNELREYNFSCHGKRVVNLEGTIVDASHTQLSVKVGSELMVLHFPGNYDFSTEVEFHYLRYLPVKFTGVIQEGAWATRSYTIENPKITKYMLPSAEHIAAIDKELDAMEDITGPRGNESSALDYCISQAESFYQADCDSTEKEFAESFWSKDILYTQIKCIGETGVNITYECQTYDGATVLEAYWNTRW
ncbi:hypothetical protein [Enterovibrio coralii]|uniref:Lipoprotein n=1 Tax=Enterovibrio coralii TaxID=294935 RepID=A0A135I5G1_9GAMM|nr:hypothetical protein [Enterovibrio coralii]KXF80692.1 hypothetical protein ATN88_08640 [Enterovibrio coralii]